MDKPQNLTTWFDHKACLIAQYLEKQNSFKYNAPPFLIDKGNLPKDFPIGLTEFLTNVYPIHYITMREGEESNYIVFLDRDMNKFWETYLVE